MTTFCSQCGKQIRENGKFCQSCGAAAVQQGQAPAAPAGGGYPAGGYGGASAGYQSTFPAQQSAPVMGQYETPAPKSGNALKIILITLAVLLILIGGAGAAGIFCLQTRREQHSPGE
jgi:hypothetical protein